MRDLALLIMLLGLIGLVWRMPWSGVLALAFVGYMHPQGYGSVWLPELPVFLLLFIAVFLATLIWVIRTRPELSMPWNWQLILMALLWAWFLVSTQDARIPLLAWPKFFDVLKLLPPLALTLLLIDDKKKLVLLLVAIALAISLVALKGGYWALMTGFHDRVYGPPGSQYGGNNEFAVAMAMAIPLLILWLRETKDRFVRALIMALVALSYAAALSSWSRGGVLALAAMSLVVLWHSKKRLLAVVSVSALAVGVSLLLSEKWFDRMTTILNWQEDGSAMSRIRVWQTGIEYLTNEPLTGGGFEGWRVLTFFQGGKIDWHSAYVEVALEHGLVGLGLWCALLFATIVSLMHFVLWARKVGQGWMADYATMLQASLVAYAVGATTLGIAYWALPFHLVVVSIILKRLAADYGYRDTHLVRISVPAVLVPEGRGSR